MLGKAGENAIAAAIVVLVVLSGAGAAPSGDRIDELPGWQGALPSAQYSGFLTVGARADRHLHYWFVESERDPSTDPVVLWLNGGPGSSSLLGFFTENGPFSTSDLSLTQNTTAVPKLFQNPWRWNQQASVLYLESPAGVGFSYCDNQDDCWFNDTKTAEDNYDALIAFFAKFPEFAKNDFYITGESYAGIYIPTLVQQVDKHPKSGINLKGFAIGDGCTGDVTGSCGNEATNITVRLLWMNGFYSTSLYNEILAACPDLSRPNAACEAMLAKMSDAVGNYYVYDIYDECGVDQVALDLSGAASRGFSNGKGRVLDHLTYDPSSQTRRHPRFHRRKQATTFTGPHSALLPHYSADAAALHGFGGALNDYRCGAYGAMQAYLQQKSVQEAIHVSTDVPSFPFNYTSTIASLLPAYPGLIEKYQVLIYSGNVDACVPYIGTEEWTTGLGIPVKETWRPWTYSDATPGVGTLVGGYVTTFDSNGFTFLTVKGSGHMVPQFQPQRAYESECCRVAP